jgi:hypothetical protein
MFGINLPGLGDIAEKICDSVLPKELHIVGDLVGGYVNFQTGNYSSLARQGMELFGDLKDLQQSLGKPQQQDKAGPSYSHEPSPPIRGRWRPAADDVKKMSTNVQIATEWRGSPPEAETSKPKPAVTTKPDEAAKPAETTKPKVPKETTEPKATTESKSKAETSKSVEDFYKKSPDDLMKAVRDGKIPDEIKDSPTEMRRLQAKMDQITEMNNLMTSMLQALHQMKMSIIQNVRV